MKKNFLYSIVALCMCLFAACSQEEIIENASQGGKTVSLSVGVPGGATTRALPSEQGYKLRCIMQVVDNANKAITGEGMRQVLEVTTDKVTFTFVAPEGDYKCLFWSDFVTDVKADNLYKTSDLTNITYNKTNDALLFSTAADAFCGYVANGTTTIQLKRPFAKVSVTPNNAADFKDFNKLTVSYNAPSGFNMVTKAVGSTAEKVTYTKNSFNVSSGAWFSSYIFAPANVDKLASAITMQLSGDDIASKTLTIEAGKVPLSENFEINGKFDAAEGGNVNVEVSFDNEFDKPEVKAPAVGDYFYADGTWGTATSNANGSAAVGVVFHIEKTGEELDDVANYDGISFTENKIRGWVVSLTATTESKVVWCDGEALAAAIPGVTIQKSGTDVRGFANSKALAADAQNSYPTNKSCLDWKPESVTGTSGWYLPGIKQLLVLQDNNTAVNNALKEISNAQPIIQDKDVSLWSSTLFEGTFKVYQLIFKADITEPSKARSEVSTATAFTRSILTF